MLSFPIMQRALLAGAMIGFLASYFGVFVVQRGLSFLGNGLAHAAFGGVALGVLLEAEPLYIAIPFTMVVAVGIIWLQERTNLHADTSIGIFFSVSMALGIVFLSKTERYTTDAFAYLFGSVLAVRESDLWMTALVVLASAGTWRLWGRWAYATFDRELARSERVPALRDDYILSLALAVTIVVSIKVVGITLIAAALVIPAAAARLFVRTFAEMTILSVLFGVASFMAGLVLSYHFDVPPGPAIVLVQTGAFLAGLVRK